MKTYFSPSALGFYLSDVCPKSAMPPDCVECGYDAYRAMVLTPIPAGFELAADEAGNPLLREVPPPSIEELRVAGTERVNAIRDRLEAGGFEYRGVVIDSDSRSVERINTAAMSALIAKSSGEAYSIEWKTSSNKRLTLDAAGMLGLQAALQAWGRRLWEESERKKLAIMSASSVEEIAAIEAMSW